jgi:hypothetical protein
MSVLKILSAVLLLVAVAPPLAAVDFIRGDVNGDGKVSIADVQAACNYFFQDHELGCLEAIDFEDDGFPDYLDLIMTFRFLVLGGDPPAPPFPAAGPDPGSTPLGCSSYGGGIGLVDPEAEIALLDSAVEGGDSRRAFIAVAISNSLVLSGYMGTIVDEAGIIETDADGTRDYSDVVIEFTGIASQGFNGARADGNRIAFGFFSVDASHFRSCAILPGRDVKVLQIPVCLKAGTPAGDYPLTLVEGEMTDLASARAISPRLVPATLTVREEIGETDCLYSDPIAQEISFRLEDTTARRGSEVEVPLLVKTSRNSKGILFAVDFDETILEVMGVDPAWDRPDGKPHATEAYCLTNGSYMAEDGYARAGEIGGAFIAVPTWERVFLPVDEEFPYLKLRFRVKPDAPPGMTEIAFVQERIFVSLDILEPIRCPWCVVSCPDCVCTEEYWAGGYANLLYSGNDYVGPSTGNSFVFVNGFLTIVGDVDFLRADATSDGQVDITDAVHILGNLFLGSPPSSCPEAADANEDGKVDLSDPVAVLDTLFLGGIRIAQPYPACGSDRGTYDLGCPASSCH